MKRKILLMDLDNVLYPWTKVMAHVLANHGITEEDPDTMLKLYDKWEVWENWGIPKGQFLWYWEQSVKDEEMYAVGAPSRPSLKAMWELSDAEWDIHIATARLNLFRNHDQAVVSTANWLKHYGIPYRSLSFSADKNRIMADAIVDDKPGNLIDHPAPLRYLFPAPHNRGWAADERSLTEAVILEEEYPWSDLVEQLGRGDE